MIHKRFYEAPLVEVICFEQPKALCQSSGKTDDYGQEDFWGSGTEN